MGRETGAEGVTQSCACPFASNLYVRIACRLLVIRHIWGPKTWPTTVMGRGRGDRGGENDGENQEEEEDNKKEELNQKEEE